MTIKRCFTRGTAVLLCGLTLFTGTYQNTQAAVVSTQELIQVEKQNYDRQHIQNVLQREQAIKSMQALGVDPKQVQERVAQMTDEELKNFNAQVEKMQAGADGGIIGLIIFVLLLLILLDLLGATDVFPAIRPIH
ncbi:MAG TPA: PA2779 family protein [Pseudomonadales bacterium]|nr:PA2779 family protein [Pseudomonadales bacterium]